MQVVIPLYNAHKQLETLDYILQKNPGLAKLSFLLIDDCSSVDLKPSLKRISSEHSNVRFIRLKRNVGLHISTYVGVINADEEIILTLDQDFIALLPELFIVISKQGFSNTELQYFIVKRQRSYFRDLSSKFTLYIINFFGGYNLKGIYSIRLFNRKHIKNTNLNKWFILDLSLTKRNLKIDYINTNISIFKKQSEISLISLTKLFFKIIIAYTILIELLLILNVLFLVIYNKQVLALICFIIMIVFSLFKFWIKKTNININSIINYDKI